MAHEAARCEIVEHQDLLVEVGGEHAPFCRQAISDHDICERRRGETEAQLEDLADVGLRPCRADKFSLITQEIQRKGDIVSAKIPKRRCAGLPAPGIAARAFNAAAWPQAEGNLL